MAIRIISDSTCDIELNDCNKMQVDIVPLTVSFKDEQYLDCVGISKTDFFEKLRKCETLPTTSQANPDGFYKLFSKYADAGDEVICLNISSKLSGTYQSALIAREMISNNEKIHVIDSKNATHGLALMVKVAVKMRDKGKSADEIVNILNELVDRVRLMVVVSSLKYLKMGGRISASTAAIGNILGVVPILSLVDGEIKSLTNVRGKKAAHKWMLSKVKEDGIDDNYPVELTHSGSPEIVNELINIASSGDIQLDLKEAGLNEIGCVIGTHTGPGCSGIAYVAAKK